MKALPERYRDHVVPARHPLAVALMRVAGLKAHSAYDEGIDDDAQELRKIRAIQLRRMADTI